MDRVQHYFVVFSCLCYEWSDAVDECGCQTLSRVWKLYRKAAAVVHLHVCCVAFSKVSLPSGEHDSRDNDDDDDDDGPGALQRACSVRWRRDAAHYLAERRRSDSGVFLRD